MTSKLALVLSALVFVAGCRDEVQQSSIDLSMNRDAGGNRDMAMQLMYQAATPKEIDTGTVSKGTAVRLTGMVVNTPVRFFESSGNTRCTYSTWVQDPDCMSGPCGLAVEIDIAKPMAGCPYADQSPTDLKTINEGDTIDVTGIVDNFPDQTSSVVQHHVEADSVVKSATQKTVTVTTVTDGSLFVSKTGAGWNMYEGMRVKVAPATAGSCTLSPTCLSVSTVDTAAPYHFRTMPGNTDWSTTYRSNYNAMDAGVRPMVGQSFKSITGTVTTTFGGEIAPSKASDFVP